MTSRVQAGHPPFDGCRQFDGWRQMMYDGANLTRKIHTFGAPQSFESDTMKSDVSLGKMSLSNKIAACQTMTRKYGLF